MKKSLDDRMKLKKLLKYNKIDNDNFFNSMNKNSNFNPLDRDLNIADANLNLNSNFLSHDEFYDKTR